jgi:hypothetical protein
MLKDMHTHPTAGQTLFGALLLGFYVVLLWLTVACGLLVTSCVGSLRKDMHAHPTARKGP